MTTPSMPSPTRPRQSGRPYRHVAIADVAALTSAPARRSIARRWSAATRSISPTASCRCCPSASRTISARCAAGEDRPSLAVRMVLGRRPQAQPQLPSHLMRSAAKLSYQQAQAAIDGKTDDSPGRSRQHPAIRSGPPMARCREARATSASRSISICPSASSSSTPMARSTRVIVPERLDAHRLIEEFMILANVAAAETLEKAKSPLIYRVHDEPSQRKAARRCAISWRSLASCGKKDAVLRPAISTASSSPGQGDGDPSLVNEVVLRSQAQAEYSPENYGHFGLNLRALRPFHLADPPLCRPDRAPRPDLVRSSSGDGALPEGMDAQEPERDFRPYFRGRTARHGGRARDQ
jgi:ribonuclease R